MLTVAQLLDELQLMAPEAAVEVWYPADTGGSYDVDIDVKLQIVHDHDQHPVAIAIIAARPPCSAHAQDPAADSCWASADVELTDRTGHRHPLCGPHATASWDGDLNTWVTAVYGGPAGPGWVIAARLLDLRWGDEPDVAAWIAHPAPWRIPLPSQPLVRRAS